MNRICSCLLTTLALGIAMTVTVPANAIDCNLSGTVRNISIQESSSGGNFFALKDTDGCGMCIGSDIGQVLLLIPDGDRGKAMLALVLSAWLSGRELKVFVSDYNSSGPTYCQARKVEVNG